MQPIDPHNSPLHIVLIHPEIAGNTGNIIRLCANTGAQLHLVRPLGFELDDARMRRAGLDYHEFAAMQVHNSIYDCLSHFANAPVFAFTAHATQDFSQATYQLGSVLCFGPESTGLDRAALELLRPTQNLRIPMRSHSRSLNLSNAVAIAAYQALGQLNYPGLSRGAD